MNPTVSVRAEGRVAVVTIERPERRNAVDLATASALYAAFKTFERRFRLGRRGADRRWRSLLCRR